MITIKEDNWYIVIGDKKPSIECPDCGAGLLGDNAPHGIREDGVVFNSVVCPCGFHDHVTIEGWTGGSYPRAPLKG